MARSWSIIKGALMARKQKVEEVGDLFVTENSVTVKLMPSKKEGTRPIRWFSEGAVTNVKTAAKDIAYLIGKLQGSSRIVYRLTVMTHLGATHDTDKAGLSKAVKLAGFSVIK
jgi:hypothetical protein